MKKILVGLVLGLVAGIIDVIPMVLQDLTWDANLSALAMWIIVGFLVATNELKIYSTIKGILISFLVLSPSAILIGWHEPMSLIPISIMTLILGAFLGFTIDKIVGSTPELLNSTITCSNSKDSFVFTVIDSNTYKIDNLSEINEDIIITITDLDTGSIIERNYRLRTW